MARSVSSTSTDAETANWLGVVKEPFYLFPYPGTLRSPLLLHEQDSLTDRHLAARAVVPRPDRDALPVVNADGVRGGVSTGCCPWAAKVDGSFSRSAGGARRSCSSQRHGRTRCTRTARHLLRVRARRDARDRCDVSSRRRFGASLLHFYSETNLYRASPIAKDQYGIPLITGHGRWCPGFLAFSLPEVVPGTSTSATYKTTSQSLVYVADTLRVALLVYAAARWAPQADIDLARDSTPGFRSVSSMGAGRGVGRRPEPLTTSGSYGKIRTGLTARPAGRQKGARM